MTSGFEQIKKFEKLMSSKYFREKNKTKFEKLCERGQQMNFDSREILKINSSMTSFPFVCFNKRKREGLHFLKMIFFANSDFKYFHVSNAFLDELLSILKSFKNTGL